MYPPPRLIRCCSGGAGIVKRKKRNRVYRMRSFRRRQGKWVGKQDLEKYSCLKARKQKHTESVRSVRKKDGAYRNGACWQLRVCLHGWCLLVVVCACVDGTCQQLCVLTWLTPAGGCVHVYNIGTYWRMCAYECLLNRGLTSCLGNVSFRVMLSFSMSKHPSQHSWIKPYVNIQVEGRQFGSEVNHARGPFVRKQKFFTSICGNNSMLQRSIVLHGLMFNLNLLI